MREVVLSGRVVAQGQSHSLGRKNLDPVARKPFRLETLPAAVDNQNSVEPRRALGAPRRLLVLTPCCSGLPGLCRASSCSRRSTTPAGTVFLAVGPHRWSLPPSPPEPVSTCMGRQAPISIRLETRRSPSPGLVEAVYRGVTAAHATAAWSHR